MLLLSTTYLGPIQYYSKLISYSEITLEKFEHFPKQTYRNRCVIYSANGPQTLSIPVSKGQELKVYTKDVRIDYSMNWQKIHFKAIESAYRSSPFYEFYIDEFLPFYEKQYQFLYDFNLELMNSILNIIGIDCKTIESVDYQKEATSNFLDLRDFIHPKQRMHRPDPTFRPHGYYQIFELKYGFIANLSIIDLLFNTGTEAYNYLKGTIVQ